MKAAQVPSPGCDFELVEHPILEPGPGWVRLKIAACGICHADELVQRGHWPNVQYPRVPGHEVVGVVDAVGPDVMGWSVGDRAGVGWHGWHCGYCDSCRSGDFITCSRQRITGIDFDGGYEEYMIASANALARIPGALGFAEAAPLLCAGVTTYNSLRHSRALPGDLVAVHGIGGLGHLGIQFASRLGYHVIALSRGTDKRELALRLGAHGYIDTGSADAARELRALGGARVIVATAPDSAAMSQLVSGLAPGGTLLAIAGSVEPLTVSPAQLIGRRLAIQGWPSGSAKDSEETLAFCALTGVRPMIETFPLAEANRAYQRMLSGQVRFRSVLVNE